MKVKKVSLKEIMEDDNHPLMKEWVDAILPEVNRIVRKSRKLGRPLKGKRSGRP